MSEDEITSKIEEWQRYSSLQQFEVAAKFAHEARSHLRNGRSDLANRKMKAAIKVIGWWKWVGKPWCAGMGSER